MTAASALGAGAIAHSRMSSGQARDVALTLARNLQHLHERAREGPLRHRPDGVRTTHAPPLSLSSAATPGCPAAAPEEGPCFAQGFVHGDLKPLNVMNTAAGGGTDTESSQEEGGGWVLIDLDAAAEVGKEAVGLKLSTAYIPPELLHLGPDGAWRVRAPGGAPVGESAEDGGCPPQADTSTGGNDRWGPLLAHPSFDMWSFGCVLFELLLRGPLWHADVDGNLLHTGADLARLGGWCTAYAKEAVGRVPDRWAQARAHCKISVGEPARSCSVAKESQERCHRQSPVLRRCRCSQSSFFVCTAAANRRRRSSFGCSPHGRERARCPWRW